MGKLGEEKTTVIFPLGSTLKKIPIEYSLNLTVNQIEKQKQFTLTNTMKGLKVSAGSKTSVDQNYLFKPFPSQQQERNRNGHAKFQLCMLYSYGYFELS